jgi:hypothetical protein
VKHSEAYRFSSRKSETKTIVRKTEGQNLYQGKLFLLLLLLLLLLTEMLRQQPSNQ